jgi:hypothetical protein
MIKTNQTGEVYIDRPGKSTLPISSAAHYYLRRISEITDLSGEFKQSLPGYLHK